MNLMRSLICAAVFAFVATPTWAQNKLDAQALKLYGGQSLPNSIDCGWPSGSRTDRRIILFSATRACPSTRPWPGRD